jgi:hypothetical protein
MMTALPPHRYPDRHHLNRRSCAGNLARHAACNHLLRAVGTGS